MSDVAPVLDWSGQVNAGDEHATPGGAGATADLPAARRRGTRRLLRAVAAPLALVLGLGVTLARATTLHDGTPPLIITVGHHVASVRVGTTLGAVEQQFRLVPRAGNLLAVDGGVLVHDAYPGEILLNGRLAPPETGLSKGDDIEVVDSKDRTERLVARRIAVQHGSPSDPEFFLGTAPGVEVVTEGSVSGQEVSRAFEPTGPFTRPRAVALTFDDGPWPGQTERVLAVLHRFHVKATFFVIGYRAQAYPDLVRAELRAGMAVGNHSWDHPNSPPFATLPGLRIDDEISRTNDLLASLGGDPHLFRPPGGSYSAAMVSSAAEMRDRIVLWSVDPKDWESGRTAKEIARNVLANVRAGSIVDLHDGGGDRSVTIRALARIIKGIRKKGLALTVIEP